MIQKLKQRSLNWYFESVWLPAHKESMHGSMIGMVRKTVADFLKFAECDARLDEIDEDVLTEFYEFSRSQGFRSTIAANRRKRIESIVQHAIPAKAGKRITAEPVGGSLRHFASTALPKLKPDLRPKTLVDYKYVVDCFCKWYGSDIDVADMTPELIEQFEEAGGGATTSIRLRTLMRLCDPILFKVRHLRRPSKKADNNGSDFLLANVYSKHYEPIALRARRPNTKRLYATTLKKTDGFLGRNATLDDLNDDTISKFAAWRLAEGLSSNSVRKDLFNILALWRWCYRKNMVENWPDVAMEAKVDRTPVAWSEAEMRQMYAAILKLPHYVGRIPACDWWAALILVAWDSGERIGAIVALTWDRVDTSSRWVNFRAEERKGGREDSAVQLSEAAVAAMQKIRVNGPAVFAWPYCYTYLWREFSRILRFAGLDDDCRSKFHRIRRSVASHAEAAGGNATAILRHSKREITKSYLDPKIVKLQQPADVLFSLAEKRA